MFFWAALSVLGSASDEDGAVYIDHTYRTQFQVESADRVISFIRCEFLSCRASRDYGQDSGGAISVDKPRTNYKLRLMSSIFIDCSAEVQGGAIYFEGINCTMYMVQFMRSRLESGSMGVAFFIGGSTSINVSEISHSTSKHGSRNMFIGLGTQITNNVNETDASVDGQGGLGEYYKPADLSIRFCLVQNNRASSLITCSNFMTYEPLCQYILFANNSVKELFHFRLNRLFFSSCIFLNNSYTRIATSRNSKITIELSVFDAKQEQCDGVALKNNKYTAASTFAIPVITIKHTNTPRQQPHKSYIWLIVIPMGALVCALFTARLRGRKRILPLHF